MNHSSNFMHWLRVRAKRPVAAAMIALLPLWATPSGAATFYWDSNATASAGGGAGNWDTTTHNWWNLSSDVAWPNASSPYDTAVFDGTAGVVVLNGTLNAGTLQFKQDGYYLAGGTLSLGGPASIDVAVLDRVMINSIIAGSSGLTKTGNGSLYLINTGNTFSGDIAITNGNLIISDPGQLGTGTTAISVTGVPNTGNPGYSGGSLVIAGTTSTGPVTLARAVSVSGRGPNAANGSGGLISVGQNTFSGTVTLGAGIGEGRAVSVIGNSTITGTLDLGIGNIAYLGGNGNWIVSGQVTGSESTNDRFGKFNGALTSTLWLQNTTNNFTDSIRIDSGTVRVTDNAVLGQNNGTQAVDLNGGTLEIRTDTPNFSARNINFRGTTGTIFIDRGIGGSGINENFVFGNLNNSATNGTFQMQGRDGNSLSISAPLSSGSLVAGTLGLPVLNWINGGNIAFTNTGNGTLTINANILRLSETSARTMTVTASGETILNGNILQAGTGAVFLTKTGQGVFTILGTASTATGNVQISQGTLSISNLASIPSGTLLLGNATTTAGTLDYTGGTATLASAITINTTTANAYINSSGSGALTLTGALTNGVGVGGAHTIFFGGSNTANNTITSTISAGVAGITSIQKIGAGTWVLAPTGNNGFTGTTTVSGGTLTLQGASGNFDILPNAGAVIANVDTFTQAAGGILNYFGAASTANTETVGALTPTAGALTINATGGSSGTAALTFASLGTVAAGTCVNFTPGAGGSITITGATNVNGILNAHLYFNGADFAAGSAVGAASYTTFAGGTALTTGNTLPYLLTGDVTGQTTATINAGIKVSSGPRSLTLASGQTLTLQNGAATVAGGILVTGGNSLTISGGTGITSGGTGDLVFRADTASDTITLSSVILANSTGGFTKNGLGTLILNAVNLGAASTINVNEGTLQLLGATTTLGAVNMSMNIRQGATFDLNGVNVGTVAAAGSAINSLNGAGMIINSGAAASLRVGNNNGSGYFTGTIGAGIQLVKAGTGTLSLTNMSNTPDNVTLLGGVLAFALPAGVTTLNAGDASPIGTGTSAASLIFNGGTLQYTGATATIFDETQSPSITSNRQFTLLGNGALDSSGTYGSNVLQATQNNAAWILNSTADLTFSGSGTRTLTLTGTSLGDNELDAHLVNNTNANEALSLTKSGAGLWILNPTSSNTFSGATTITGGALQVQPLTAAVQGLSANSNIVLNGGVLQTSGYLNLSLGTAAGQISWTGNGGFSASTSKLIVNLGGGATLNLGTAPTAGSTIILSNATALADVELQNSINLGTAARTIQVDDNTSTGLDFATISGSISGGTGGSLAKTGAGTLILSDFNTYVGNTVLQVGALAVTSIGAAGASSTSIGTNVGGGILQIGATTNTPTLLYVGSGEITTRQISLIGTTGTLSIDSSGSGPLVLTNVTNNDTGAFIFQVRGTNTDANMITSQLTNNGANVMTFTKADSGVWILNPTTNNTFTGNLNASGGMLGLTAAGIGNAGNVVLTNSGIFAYGADLTTSTNFILGNNSTAVFGGSNNITVNGTLTKASGANDQTLSNNLDNSAVLTFNGNLIDGEGTANATRTIFIRGYGATVFNGIIQNNTTTTTNIIRLDIRLSNAGSVTLGGNNAGSANGFTGGILLGQGTLNITNVGALGPVANNLIFDGGVLTSTVDLSGTNKIGNAVFLQGDPLTISSSNNIEFGGVVALNASRSLVNNLSGGTLTLSGGITNSAASTLTIFGSGNTLLSAAYNAGTGANNLTYSGTGSLTLSAANAATGSLTANRSTITLNGAATWAGTIVVNSGGTITLDNSAGSVNRLADAGAVTGQGGTLNFIGASGGTTEATGALTINSVQTYITMSGAGSNVLNFASVNFANSGSTLNLSGVSGLGSTNQVTFTAAPSGAAIVFSLTGGAGMIPRIILGGTDFAKYSATNGVIALAAGDYNSANNLNTALTTDALDLTATSSITQARTISALKLDGSGVSAGGSAGARLTITSGGLINTAGNNSLDATSVSFTNTPVIQVAAGTTLTVNSAMLGSTNLVKVLSGTLQINTPSFVTGTQNLLNGTTVLNGGLNTLFANQLLNINAGATLDLNGNTQFFAQLSDPGLLPGTGGIITSNGAAALLVSNMNPGSTTLATVINDGTGGGVVSFARIGGNTLTLETASNYSGATYLLGGTTTLQDDATLLNTASIDINAATLFLQNNASLQTANNNRIGDTIAINLRDGTLSVTGRVDYASSETFGALTSAQGANTITASLGGTGTAGAFDSISLTFASLTRNAGTTVVFNGTNLGQQGNSSTILFTSPLTTVDGGALGAWAIANSTDYAAYNSGIGVGVVGTGGFVGYTPVFDLGNITEIAGAQNATTTTNLTSDTTTGLLKLSDQTFNNITFATATTTLNLEQGGLLRSNNNFGSSIGTTAAHGVLTAGGTETSGIRELVIFDNGSANPSYTGGATTVGSPVVTGLNTIGLQPGMTVTNANFPAGTVIVSIQNSGQVTLSNNATATASSQTFVAGVGDVGAATSGSAVVTMASTVGISAGMTITGTGIPTNTFVVSVDSATQVTLSQNATVTGTGLTLTLGYSNMIINAVIADNGAGNSVNLIKSGAGVLSLSAANTYTGGTTIVQGTINLISGGTGGIATNVVLPSGGIILGGASLIEMANSGQIDPSNTITLRRSSTLTLVGNNTLNSLVFDNNGGTTNPTVNVGGILTLTNATPVSVTSGDALTVPTITGGTLSLGNGPKTIVVDGPTLGGQLYTTINPALSIASIISGTGVLTKSGTGILQLSAQNTFSGLIVTGGGIAIAGNSTQSAGTVTSGPLGVGTVSMAAGTEFLATTSNTIANAISFAGTPTFDSTANTAWTLTFTGAMSGAGVTGSSITVNVVNPGLTVALLGSFPGTFSSITKTGLGTLIFNATNYTGDFNATALGNPNAISLINDGDGSGLVQTLAMGNVVFDSGIVPNITVNRGGSLPFPLAVNKILAPASVSNTGLGITVTNSNGYGLLISDATAFTSTPTISVGTATASNVTQGLYLTGNLTGTGFNKTGAGTLVINNATPANNTFTGNINITQGIVSVGVDGQLGNAANLIVLNPSTGTAAFRATGTFSTSQVIQLANTANIRAVEVTSGNTLTLSSAFDLNGGAGSTAALNKQDLGTLVINASNSGWSGQINITEGAILVNNPALTNPLGTGTIVASPAAVFGSALQLAGGVTISNPLTLQGAANFLNGGINFQGALDNVSGTNFYAGGIAMTFDTTIGARAGSTLNISGLITATGTHRLQFNAEGDINLTGGETGALFGFDKYGQGMLTISTALFGGTITTGGVKVEAGTLKLTGAGTINSNGAVAIVYNGATMILDNSGANTNNRLTGKALTLQGGLLNFISNNSTETAGAFVSDQGSNVINLGGSGTAALTFATLTSNAGSTLNVTGSFGAASNFLKFTTAPTLTPGTTGILNRVTVNGNELASYSATLGVIAFTNYATTNNILSTTATQTFKATGSTLNSLTGSQTLNALTINNTAAVGGLGGNPPATLTLTSGTILANGSGGAFLNVPIVAFAANEGIIHVQSGQSLTVNSGMSGTGGMSKDLAGELDLNAQQFVSGATYINEGTVKLTTSGITNTLLYNQALAINYSGTLDLNGNNQFVAGLSSATAGGGNQIAGGSVINSGATQSTFTINGNTNFAGVISGNIYLDKTGTGALNLQNAQTYTGATLITGGTMTLNDLGALSNTTSITINYGGLSLANGNLYNVNDRVNDSAAISMSGATLTYAGRQQLNSTETLGAVTLVEGLNYINSVTGGTNVNSAILTLASLSRAVGSTATLRFNGSSNSLGTIGSTANVLVTSAPTLTNNIIGPWAIVDREWASYDPTYGIGQLNANGFAGYSATSLIGGPTGTDNVRFTTAGTTVLASDTTVGTLDFASQATATVLDLGGNTLTIQNGGLLIAQATDNVDFSIQNGSITSGVLNTASDFYITHANFGGTNRTFTLNAPIVDNGTGAVRVIFTSGQIEAAGVGNTIINSVNTYTGGSVINSGNIVLGATGQLGTGGLTVNQAIFTQTAGGIIPSSNVITLGGGSLVNLANQANTLAGIIVNNLGGAAPTLNPTGVLTLTGGITSTSVNAGNAAVIGTGTLDLNAASSFAINVSPTVVNGVVVAPWQSDLTINAVIQNGGIVLSGGGMLQLTAQNTFAGGINVTAGGLIIGASSIGPNLGDPLTSGPLGTGTVTMASGTSLVSTGSFSVTNNFTFLGDTVFNGTNSLTLNGNTILPSVWNATVTAPQMTVTIGNVINSLSTDVVNKSGLGTLTLGNYNGTINIAGGLIFLADGNTLGTAESVSLGGNVILTDDTAITVNRSGGAPFARNKNVQKVNLTNNGSILAINNLSGYGLEFTGTISLTGASHFSVATATASNVVQGLTLSGIVSDTGGFSLVKSGLGTLALTNSGNTFGGVGATIDVLNGILAASSDGALGNINNTITLEVDGTSGTGFRAMGTFSTARTFLLNAPNDAFEVTAGNTLTLNTAFSFSAVTNTLTKNDNGILAINADNFTGSAWNGTITINAGAIQMQNGNAIGSGAITINNAIGSALQLSGGVNVSNAVTINGSSTNGGINNGGHIESVSGNNTYSGLITQASGIAGSYGADAGATLNITGGISAVNSIGFIAGAGGVINLQSNYGGGGAGGPTFNKFGAGTLNVTSTQSAVTAAINITGGTMSISGSGVKFGATGLVTIAATSTLLIDDTGIATANRLSARAVTLQGGTFSYLGNTGTSSETLGALTMARGNNTILANSNGGTSTITFANLASNIVAGDTSLNFASLGAALGSANNKILLTTGPTLTGNIIQRATVNGTDFATWTAGNGIAAFTAYQASNNVNTAAATDTMNLTAAPTALTANRTVNALKFNSATGLTLSGPATGTGSVGGNTPFQLTLTAGAILATGGGADTLSVAVLNNVAVQNFFSIDTGTSLNITSTIVGTGGWVKTGAGTLTISAPVSPIAGMGANTLTGNGNISNGSVILNGGTNTLAANQFMAVSAGGTLDLNGNSQMVRGLFTDSGFEGGGGIVTSALGSGTLVMNNDTGTRNWSGQLTGALSFMRTGDGTSTFYSDNTYTGHTYIGGGTTNLRDGARLSGTTDIQIAYGTLNIDNTNGVKDLSDRINDAATITLCGGTLALLGRAQTASSETVGAVTLAEGNSFINSVVGGTGINSTDFTLTSLNRAVGGGTVNLTAATAGQIGSSSRILISTINGVSTSTVGGGLTNGMIGGWAIIGTGDFATYIPGLGVAALGANGALPYDNATSTINTLNLAGTTDNISLNVAVTGNIVLVSNDLTINSLRLGNVTGMTINIASGKTLTLASGGLLFFSNQVFQIGSAVNQGSLTSGGPELFIYTQGSANEVINSAITGVGVALIKSGSGQVTLNGTNTYDGGTTINQGTLTLGLTGNIPLAANVANGLVLSGATFSTSAAGQIAAGNIVTLNGNSTLNLAGSNILGGLVFNEDGGGSSANQVVSNFGVLTLNGNITSSSTSPAAIPTIVGRVDFGATMRTLNISASTFNGQATSPLQSDFTLQGVVGSAGGITKTGNGVLLLGQEVYTGATDVQQGRIQMGGNNDGARFSALTLESGTALNLNGASAIFGSLAGSGFITNSGTSNSASTLTVGFDDTSTTFSGLFLRFNDATPANLALAKIGAGTLTFDSDGSGSTVTGSLTISRGAVTFTNNGTSSFPFAAIQVNAGGTLNLDNTGTVNIDSRLRNGAVTLNGGVLNYLGAAATASAETGTGVLTLGPGASNINLTNGAGGTAFLKFGSLSLQGGATASLSGVNLGTSTRLLFTTAPTLTGSIISRIMVGTDFATYDTTKGIIAYTGYVTPTDINSAAGTATIKVDSTTTGLTLNLGRTINALDIMANNVTIGSTGLLLPTQGWTITSGGILVNGDNAVINTPVLALGAEGIFWVNGSGLNVQSAIIGTSGLTKTGAGSITLATAQAYTGLTTLSQGTMTLAGGRNTILVAPTLTVNAGNLQVNGGTLDLNGNNQTVGALLSSNTLATATGIITNSSATAVVFSSASATNSIFGIDLTGNLSFTKSGNSTLTFPDVQSYTGATIIRGGTLTLQDKAVLYSGVSDLSNASITLNFATLNLNDSNLNTLSNLTPTRLPAAVPVILNGGVLTLTGGGSVDSSVTINTLTVTNGQASINVVPFFNSGGTALITIGNLIQNPASGSVVNFVGFSTNNGLSTSSLGGQGNSVNGNITLGQINGTAGPVSYVMAATTTANNATVTVASTASLVVGMAVNGANIPVGATIATITSATTFTLNSGTGVVAGTNVALNANSGLTNNLIGGWAVADGSTFATYLTGAGVSVMGQTTQGLVAPGFDGTNISATTLATQNINDASTARTITGAHVAYSWRSSGTTATTFTLSSASSLSLGVGWLTNGNVAYNLVGTDNTSTLTSSNPFLYVFVNQSTTSIGVNITGAISLVKSGGATLTLNNTAAVGSNTYTGGTYVQAGTLNLTGAAGTILIPGDLFINNATVTMNTNAGQIAAASNITIHGGGVLNLTGTNTLNSVTFYDDGGTGTPTVATSTLLTLTAANAITAANDNLSSTPTISGTKLVLSNAAPVITVNAGLSPSGLIITAPLDTTGGGVITKAGSGSLILNGGTANVLTGGLNVTAGTLVFDNTAATNPYGVGIITLSDGVAIRGGTAARTVGNAISALANFTFGTLASENATANATNNLTLSGTVTLAGTNQTITVNGLLMVGTISGQLTGGTNLTKDGAGTLVLSKNTNNYGGTTTVSAGTLQLGAAGVIPDLSALFISYGAFFNLNGFNETIGSLAGAGVATNTGAAATLTTGVDNTSTTFSGNITNQANALNLIKTGNGTQTLSGANNYTGTTTISGGTLQFAQETALYNNTPASWTATNLVVNSGTTAAFNVGGTGEFTASDIAIIQSLGTATGGFKNGSTIGLDTTNATGGTFTYATAITDTNAGANAVGVTKLGAGTLALTGTNTYTGPTTVTAGTLQVGDGSSGALNGNGTVTVVQAGSTIATAPVLSGGSGGNAGVGVIAGVTIIGDTSNSANAGVIAPGVGATGTSNQTLTFTATGTALTVASGSQMQLGITTATSAADAGVLAALSAGSYTDASSYITTQSPTWTTGAPAAVGNYDFINLTAGTLSLGTRIDGTFGHGTVEIIDNGYLSGVQQGDVFNLLDWQGILGGTFTTTGFTQGGVLGDIDLPTLTGNLFWDTSAFSTYGVLVVVPEPSRVLFLLLGFLGLGLRRRRTLRR